MNNILFEDLRRVVNVGSERATWIDVLSCYKLLLGRDADGPGLESYIDLINQGISTADVVNSFLRSGEFLRSSNAQAVTSSAGEYRGHINEVVIRETGLRVISGPFQGMRLIHQSSRGDGDISPKLLGTYEEELHPALRKLAGINFEEILDIGCAEGYYTIGCALLYKNLPVVGYDTNKQALEITRELARINEVSDLVTTSGFCNRDVLIDRCRGRRKLVIADCEGYEKELFGDKGVAAACGHSYLIIECHDVWDATITPTILESLSGTHDIEVLESIGRNPNRFTFLKSMNEVSRWMAVCERRSASQNWLICKPKSGH